MATDSHDQFAMEPKLPGDVIEDILAADRRRTALSCLSDHGGEMAVTDLAACVCAREDGVPAAAVDAADRDRLYDELYDRHLPKLIATGIVTFDSLRDTVTLTAECAPETGRR